jgi:uncharacterized DUF497 family protein
MRFEWDEEKRLANWRKHGIDFADVESVFADEVYTIVDDRFDYNEIRYLSLGLLFGEIIAISHTETDEIIRFISARKAEKHEQETYFKAIRD